MLQISSDQHQQFCRDGFIVVPNVLNDEQLRRAQAYASGAEYDDLHPNRKDHRRIFEESGDVIRDLYQEAGIGEMANQLLRADLRFETPGHAQIIRTTPPYDGPAVPHFDTPGNLLPDGFPTIFNVLVGVWLCDHYLPDRPGVWVWPGSHILFGQYLSEHGTGVVWELAQTNGVRYPDVALDEPVQLVGTAGSVVFAHYLLGHASGPHQGEAPVRETLYFRIVTSTIRETWKRDLCEPLSPYIQAE
ncbi:phytanoyl-CoA dioxygenase family protein [Streptomyces sp. NPDC006333]|uniref:phytanoyl-CoA dioxygenase family protein n=1 Tax=Streptomyces sp. NPDC006333 TaxID=3156753 RepID=UPI0033B31503